MAIGPAPLLAALVGIANAAIFILLLGAERTRLVLLFPAAVLGAYAGQALALHLPDPLRIGDFGVLWAAGFAWLGILDRRARGPARPTATPTADALTGPARPPQGCGWVHSPRMPHRPSPQARPDPRLHALPAAEIRARFVAFFEARGHTVVPSASLVPAGDKTLLFTNSGMVQFKDVFTGVETRSYAGRWTTSACCGSRASTTTSRRSGGSPRHHTFFEMLGNWSFGDYFKREAIHWAWELLTEEFGIPAERLAATTYKDDEVARAVWRDEIGLPPERMAIWGDVDAGDDKNFWRMADTGPCGPCSEIHFDRGAAVQRGPGVRARTTPRRARAGWRSGTSSSWSSIRARMVGCRCRSRASTRAWASNAWSASSSRSAATTRPTSSRRSCARLRELLGHDEHDLETQRFSYQVIADHARAVTFLVADGVRPSNEGRGYVLRKLVRRAVRHGRLLGRDGAVPGRAGDRRREHDGRRVSRPRTSEPQRSRPCSGARRRSSRERSTLGRGSFEQALARIVPADAVRNVGRRAEDLPPTAPALPGDVAFRLHDTYGFPIDLTVELAAEAGVRVDVAGYETALEAQRARSRKGTKAGLSGAGLVGLAVRGAAPSRRPHRRSWAMATTTAEGRVLAIVRDDVEYEELQGHGPAEVVLDHDAVLRGGWRPGRRSRRGCANRAAARCSSRWRTPSGRSAARSAA